MCPRGRTAPEHLFIQGRWLQMLQLMLFLERPQVEAGKIYFVCLEVIYSLLLQGMGISGFEGNVLHWWKQTLLKLVSRARNSLLISLNSSGFFIPDFPCVALGYSKPRISPADQDLANERNEMWPG